MLIKLAQCTAILLNFHLNETNNKNKNTTFLFHKIKGAFLSPWVTGSGGKLIDRKRYISRDIHISGKIDFLLSMQPKVWKIEILCTDPKLRKTPSINQN